MNQYFIHDARKINELPIKTPVDLIITSPPYFDMKDYGSKNQIGYGQQYGKYLDDIGLVFSECYKVAKDTSSLWIVIDILRKNGETKLLPFDVIQKVRDSGWHLQDILIWKKDKTVPFAHQGQMRNIFEYILYFTKTNNFKFYKDRITSINDLKEWWQKYPERYSPEGKLPTNIWDFPIPLQGSWGNKYIKHFCPLPEKLIEQIINLSSDIGDTVLDPFAGSGAVLSAAHRLNRKYIGCDLNESYREMFLNYIKKVKPIDPESLYNQETLKRFSKTIKKLRLLKLPKKVHAKYKQLHTDGSNILAIIAVPESTSKELAKYKLASCNYIFITSDGNHVPVDELNKIISKPPLSKYGIEAKFKIMDINSAVRYSSRLTNGSKIWKYSNGVTYQRGQDVGKLTKLIIEENVSERFPPVFSTIELKDDELEL